MSRYNLRNMRSPEEGPSTRAGPSTSGGSGHIASDQWRGRLRAPRRGEGSVLDPETASAPEPEPCTSRRRGRPGTHRGRNSPPHRSVLPQQSETTTRRGLPRQRMAWTIEMNEEVMRSYFIASELGNLRIGYRSYMKRLFVAKYPELAEISEQRLADQRRAICTNNLLNIIRMEELRTEIEREMNRERNRIIEQENGSEEQFNDINHMEGNEVDSELEMQMQSTEIVYPQNEIRFSLLQEYERALVEYGGMLPDSRPRLPRIQYSKKLVHITSEMNSILESQDWNELDSVQIFDCIYCATVAITRCMGLEVFALRTNNQVRREREPAWKLRLDRKIEQLRKDIGRLYQWIQGKTSKRLRSKVNTLLSKLKFHSSRGEENRTPEACLDTLKQRLSVLVERRSRYLKSYRRASDNKAFGKNESKFYRNLRDQTESLPTKQHIPNMESVADFWKSVWGSQRMYDTEASWLRELEATVSFEARMPEITISEDNIKTELQGARNWATPGRDGIYCYYLKKLTATHKWLAKIFNQFLSDPTTMPMFLTHGSTTLISKEEDRTECGKYRPITCLPVLYKLLTGIVARHIETHCSNNAIMAEQQKGCERYAIGCKEQLLIDAVVTGQAIHMNRHLYAAYIDFTKAYDSVPHSWIMYVLKLYGIADQVCEWIQVIMGRWCTSLVPLQGDISPTIKISRGIFQGDALSPLLFCLALNPLSFMLNRTDYGFSLRHETMNVVRVSHLLYMDDLKLYASSQNQLQQMLDVVNLFAKTVNMEFGLKKCRTQAIVGGRHMVVGFTLGANDVLPMEEGDVYKYLGMLQTRGTNHKAVRAKCEEEFIHRLTLLLKTGLNAGNLAKAINSFAVPVLTYSFGVTKWSTTHLEALERRLRVVLTKYSCHHPRASIERVLLPRSEGGRGLGQIVIRHDECLQTMQQYFLSKAQHSRLIEAICRLDKNYTPLRLARGVIDPGIYSKEELITSWKGKALHGRYRAEIECQGMDVEASFAWLKAGYLFPETEGFLVAIQDQVVATKNYLKMIVGSALADDRCRMCRAAPETIQHLLAGCSKLAPEEYLTRHNNVAKIIHQELALKFGLSNAERCPYYKYEPEAVLENDRARLYWDRSILTDRPAPHNRPDIVLINKPRKEAFLIDVAVPACHNVIRTSSEKINKYEQLAQEIKTLLHMKEVNVVPIIISAVGTTPLSLKAGLRLLGLKEELHTSLQKAAILATCSMIRRVVAKTK